MKSIRLSRLAVRARQAAERLAPAAALLTRWVAGQTFILTGLGKLRHLERTAEFFGSLGLPLPGAHALLIGTLELVGGVALLLGLGTRLFGLLLAGTMGVALLTADRAALVRALPGGGGGPTDVAALVLLLLLVWLVAAGAGPISVDRALFRRRAR